MNTMENNWAPYIAKFGNSVVSRYKFALQEIEHGDPAKALPELFELAEADFDPAIHSLAHCIENGIGVPSAKPDIAFELYTRAAKMGNPSSQNELGVFHLAGLHTEKDEKKALGYFGLAMKQGHLAAIYNVAYMLDLGLGTDADGPRALKIYEAAARHEHAGAMNAIGVYHICGRHVKPDPSDAEQWFIKAENLGCFDAQKNLSLIRRFQQERASTTEFSLIRKYLNLWFQDSIC